MKNGSLLLIKILAGCRVDLWRVDLWRVDLVGGLVDLVQEPDRPDPNVVGSNIAEERG
jgi:hypothetical protein